MPLLQAERGEADLGTEDLPEDRHQLVRKVLESFGQPGPKVSKTEPMRHVFLVGSKSPAICRRTRNP